MTSFVHIEPGLDKRREFARWALAQTPKIQTSSSTGSDVPVELYPDVPFELLEGAFVDGFPYGGAGTTQTAAVPAARASKTPEPTEAPKPRQKAAQAPAKRARKQTPRQPRKASRPPLKAERVAAEGTGNQPDGGDEGTSGSGTDSANV